MKKICAVALLLIVIPLWSKPGANKKEHIAQIEARLRMATPCPWTSDGYVAGWWNGEMSGVGIRATVNRVQNGYSSYVDAQGRESNVQPVFSSGQMVAEVFQSVGSYGTGSHNPVADADFIAHSCEDIQYLLELAKSTTD